VLPLCAAAAEVLAACSGYTPDRTPCALYHGPVLAWEWLVGCWGLAASRRGAHGWIVLLHLRAVNFVLHAGARTCSHV
jgi:hypothetical protein